MGQDKGLLPFRGESLIERVIHRVSHIADELVVITNKPDKYGFLNLPLFSDIFPGRGALGGMYTALSVASNDLVSVVACDMPFVNSKVLAAELDWQVATNSDIVIPHTGKGLEPFHAIYRRKPCLPEIGRALDNDQWRIDSWFSKVNLIRFDRDQITRYDPDMLCFFNINTPDDLNEAVRISKTQGD